MSDHKSYSIPAALGKPTETIELLPSNFTGTVTGRFGERTNDERHEQARLQEWWRARVDEMLYRAFYYGGSHGMG